MCIYTYIYIYIYGIYVARWPGGWVAGWLGGQMARRFIQCTIQIQSQFWIVGAITLVVLHMGFVISFRNSSFVPEPLRVVL